MQLRDYRALRYESEELAAPCKRQRNDEGAEDEHLRHQEEKDLEAKVSIHATLRFVNEYRRAREQKIEA